MKVTDLPCEPWFGKSLQNFCYESRFSFFSKTLKWMNFPKFQSSFLFKESLEEIWGKIDLKSETDESLRFFSFSVKKDSKISFILGNCVTQKMFH